MQIPVQNIESEEYYLENGVFEHACPIIPPKYGKATCETCGNVIVDDFDYSDEIKDARECL